MNFLRIPADLSQHRTFVMMLGIWIRNTCFSPDFFLSTLLGRLLEMIDVAFTQSSTPLHLALPWLGLWSMVERTNSIRVGY